MPILSLLTAATLACTGGQPPVDPPLRVPTAAIPVDSTLRRLFDGGQRYGEFVAAAQQRKAQWEENAARAAFPDALVARARATGGPWKLLVVAVDGCSDSVNTIPYLARMMEQVPGVELRIIGSAAGRAIMDAHRTPDGRGATPTVLLLDADYVKRGAWIERPAALQSWILAQKGVLDDSEVFTRKMRWYDEDRGRQTVEEIVALMERAPRG